MANMIPAQRNRTYAQTRRCRKIIHMSALVGGLVAAGLAQLPASDNALLVPLEITMVISLGAVFGLRFRDSFRTSLVVTTAATMIGRGVSEFLFGWVPVLGNIWDCLTAIIVIEVLGWVIVKDFENR